MWDYRSGIGHVLKYTKDHSNQPQVQEEVTPNADFHRRKVGVTATEPAVRGYVIELTL